MHKEKFDYSDLTDDERKQKGLETEAETEARVAKQTSEKSETKAKSPKKTTKGKKDPKSKAAKTPKAKKAPKPKAKDTRAYVFHKDTKADPITANAQSAPKLGVEKAELNEKEKAVLAVVKRHPGIEYPTLVEKADLGPKGKRASWTRNALRRLVREGFVKKTARGVYAPGRAA